MTGTPRKRGRPPSENRATCRLDVRLTTEDLARYKAAAEAEGVGLSVKARELLDEWASRETAQ
jgi:hypothetical protein